MEVSIAKVLKRSMRNDTMNIIHELIKCVIVMLAFPEGTKENKENARQLFSNSGASFLFSSSSSSTKYRAFVCHECLWKTTR
jgi:hypothetical protein